MTRSVRRSDVHAERNDSEKERPMRNILISAFTAAAVLGVAGTASAQQIHLNFGPNPSYVPPVIEHVKLKPWGRSALSTPPTTL
jgi:hypothetical protein